jgi:hypothetical protein
LTLAGRLFPQAARTDLCLGLAAGLIGLCGLGSGLVAVVVLLVRALGPVQAAAVLAGLLLAVALMLWLILRLRQRARRRQPDAVPAYGNLPAEPAVFATFLVGFLLARRFLGRS